MLVVNILQACTVRLRTVRPCYGLRGIYGRFDSKFDSIEKKDSQVPTLSICNLLNERRAAASMKGMQITNFREQLCSQLLQFDESTAAMASSTASSSRHYLGTTTQKQSGKRPDCHLRKYCIGCYEALKKTTWKGNCTKESQASYHGMQSM